MRRHLHTGRYLLLRLAFACKRKQWPELLAACCSAVLLHMQACGQGCVHES